MTTVADRLRAIADELDGKVTVSPDVVPAGMAAVHPTGVKGVGKTRYWPLPTTILNENANLWAYLVELARERNPATGMNWVNPGVASGLFPTWANRMAEAGQPAYPEIADRMQFPEDWYNQAELDQLAALKARDAGIVFGPQDVPIASE